RRARFSSKSRTGSRRWAGLSARYDAPAPAADSRGAVRTAWDDLSEGVDPTTSDP
ncbi:MAG TPA: Trp biosynthesis-associated membrane protein, partial [Dermatophilaceae bacterium]|nr:Trp biosynthesis-associated membrane protein [Dermatophilaceae bacterium]